MQQLKPVYDVEVSVADDAVVGHSLHHEGGGPQRFSLSLVGVGDQRVIKHHSAQHHLA